MLLSFTAGSGDTSFSRYANEGRAQTVSYLAEGSEFVEEVEQGQNISLSTESTESHGAGQRQPHRTGSLYGFFKDVPETLKQRNSSTLLK